MEEDEENVVERKGNEYWSITAHVHGKQFSISVGDGSQGVKWLGHVAIARWDEDNHQGWKKLGIPIAIRSHSMDGFDLDMSLLIKDALQNGDHIFVLTSLQPHETSLVK